MFAQRGRMSIPLVNFRWSNVRWLEHFGRVSLSSTSAPSTDIVPPSPVKRRWLTTWRLTEPIVTFAPAAGRTVTSDDFDSDLNVTAP